MNVFVHDINGSHVAEMQSEGIVIRGTRDAAEIAGELLIRRINKLILHERNLCPEFWELSNGLAGAVLQEFASKAVAVAFVGNFNQLQRENFIASLRERHPGNQVYILDSVEMAKKRLTEE